VKETVASLKDRLGEAIAPFTRDGISYRSVLEQSLLTPSCGLASLSLEAADHALDMLARLSELLRRRL
ncbi:MAG: methionine synthase, partial [Dehalococcoidia bacterium]|nr:methionine synthase [Dehalococcoidia bacterium]